MIKSAFANALALTSVLVYSVLYLIERLSPELFVQIYNSLFMGSDVASLYLFNQDINTLFTNLLVVAFVTWVFGYLLAGYYNLFVSER